jgi:hypothetical protein
MKGKLDFFVAPDAVWTRSEQLTSSAKTCGTSGAVRLKNLETYRNDLWEILK